MGQRVTGVGYWITAIQGVVFVALCKFQMVALQHKIDQCALWQSLIIAPEYGCEAEPVGG
ncbi:MAG: hypothetical protein QNJ64_06955 [Crocosphaera sp.]|nr:hypothetical protein [Crocosphaera sp.]